MIVVGLVYRTPFPVQPMKAIGSVAATHTAAGVALTAGTFHLAALLTGLVWLGDRRHRVQRSACRGSSARRCASA